MPRTYVKPLKRNITLPQLPDLKKSNYYTPSKKELKLDSEKFLKELQKEENKMNSNMKLTMIMNKKNSFLPPNND